MKPSVCHRPIDGLFDFGDVFNVLPRTGEREKGDALKMQFVCFAVIVICLLVIQ